MLSKEIIRESVTRNSEKFDKLSNDIWSFAETAFEEYRSMDALCEALADEGFEVKKGVADIPTAFTGTFGHGKPIIGILGEYDALAAINQKSGSEIKEPTSPEMIGKPGHGCGHNCLGAASVAAAVAAKDYLKATGKEGTVIYFGCPAEEGGSGKAFMAREGLFKDLDAAFTWHPMNYNGLWSGTTSANYQVLYKFKGIAGYAAQAMFGRSALDAVEIMNVNIQFLREHMEKGCSVHYAILDTGGYSPNVVQPTASVLYLIRAPKMDMLERFYQRVNKCAQAAALATETEVEIDFVKACSYLLSNATLEKVMYDNMERIGVPQYTPEEYAYADRLRTSYAALESSDLDECLEISLPEQADEIRELFKGNPSLNAFLLPFAHSTAAMAGSTDVSDVSLNCPTAQIRVVTNSSGCPNHSWQRVAQTNSSIAHKGEHFAAEVIASSFVDIIENPELLKKAKEEFDKATGGQPYVCPIPKGVKPRVISNLI